MTSYTVWNRLQAAFEPLFLNAVAGLSWIQEDPNYEQTQA
jgi:hypothetical protein